MNLSNLDKMRIMEWYQHIRSTNPTMLEEKDHKMAKEIRKSFLESKEHLTQHYRR